MNTRQVAAMLGRTIQMVRRYVEVEGLPCRREGHRLVFDEAEVLEWRNRPEVAARFLYGNVVKHGKSVRVPA